MSAIPEGITHLEVTDSGANFWSITEPDDGTGEVWLGGKWMASEISDRLMQRLMPVTGTLSHRWTEDPHAGQYDGERADLALGDFTDDELANAVFLHGNEMPDIGAVFAGKAKMPIVYLFAAKERIRWLSRKLDATLQALAVWERPEPWGENDIIPLGVGSITGEAYRRGVESGRKVGTPILSELVSSIERFQEDPDLRELETLLANLHHVATHPLPGGLEVRAEGEANFYSILKDGNWVARVQMNGEMTTLRQTALLHAVCRQWKDRPLMHLPPRMTEQREIQELLGRFGVYGAVPTGVATQIYNAALDHTRELNGKLAELPIKVVADVSGGALHGVYAEVPVRVLFISDDADDVSAMEENLGEDGLHRDTNGNLIASWYLASNGGADAEVVRHYFTQE